MTFTRENLFPYPSAPDLLALEFEPEIVGIRSELARTSTDPEVLRALAKQPSPSVRKRVAGNAHAGADTLHTLARDEEPSVRRAVAGNPNTPARAIGWLSGDPDVTVAELAGKRIDAVRRKVLGAFGLKPQRSRRRC